MSELQSSAVEKHVNRNQAAGDILREAFQPDPVEETPEVEEVLAEAETEEVLAEEPAETVEATDETEQKIETSDPVAISTLSELAEAIEVDNDFLYNIKVPMPDGQEAVSLSALKDAYTEKNDTTTAAMTQLEQQREAFEQEKEQYTQQFQQLQQMPEELLTAQAEVRAIASQYQSFDWTELEKLDPGRAALEKQDMATRYSQAEARVAQVQQAVQQQQQSDYERMRTSQEQQLLVGIPEWGNPEVRTKDATAINTFMLGYGFNQQEINATGDPRTIKMLRDYMLLKSKFDEATTAKKAVMKTPKSLKPGAPKVQPTVLKKQQEKMDRARKSKDPRVKVSAIADLIS